MAPEKPGDLFSKNKIAAQERKDQILERLKAWVAEKKNEDPDFNITLANMTNEFIPMYQGEGNLFAAKANAQNAILKYFWNDIDFLREKLGLPKGKK